MIPRLVGAPTLHPRWLLLLVVGVVAVGYANALQNGWAYDDVGMIVRNPVVTESQWERALTGPYRSDPNTVTGLYRPTTLLAFTAQWWLFGDHPAAFHAVSITLHALVAVLVVMLLAEFLPLTAAAAGGALFAAHPVHVEAVANVVGQAELLAALAYLCAALVYLRAREASAPIRALRLLGILALYALGLGAKEIAITLPAVLVLLEVGLPRPSLATAGASPLGRALLAVRAEAPLYIGLGALVFAYLTARWLILGSLRGDEVAAELFGLGAGARTVVALSSWPTLVRVLFLPIELSADYGPGVLPAPGAARALVGATTIAGLAVVALASWRRSTWSALAAAWLLVTVLPVSNLIVPAGVVLAERTLYLPSVALAMAAGGALVLARQRPMLRAGAWTAAVAVIALLGLRTALRNPTWASTQTAMETLAREQPESWRVRWRRGVELARMGRLEPARAHLDAALELVPYQYEVLRDAGLVYARLRRWERANDLLGRAVELHGERRAPYQLLAEAQLLAGDVRAAHATALAGIARTGPDRTLWAYVSESYAARGDLAAAIRARQAALAADPTSEGDRARLADLVAARDRREPGPR